MNLFPEIVPTARPGTGPFPDDACHFPEGAHVDGSLARGPVHDEVDYVVVGSGAGGATAAVTLAEAGWRVALVEEGPWVRTPEFVPHLLPSMARLFRDVGTAAMRGRSFIPIMQGRCVGGSTTVNSAIAWRAPDSVLRDWSTRFGLGDSMGPEVLAPHYDFLDDALSVRPVSDASLGENNALFGVATHALGMESHRIRRYDRGCQGAGECLTGCPTARKQSMAVTFVPRTLLAGGKIFSHARVDRVDVRAGRAVGVFATLVGADGPQLLYVRARRGVFVAASAIQTPDVLRRSGVRARALGQHFQCHPGVSIAGRFAHPVRQDFGAVQGYNSMALLETDRLKFESLMLPPELAAARLPGMGASLMRRLADYPHLAIWAVIVRSDSEGRVVRQFGNDQVLYTPSRLDMERLRKGLRVLTEMMFAAGAQEVYPGVAGMPTVLGPSEISRWDDATLDPRGYNSVVSHMFGPCRMGPDPRDAVVDPTFTVHGVRGLRVVDSSVFPTNLGVNPQHTIMAMSRLAAHRALERPETAI